MVDPITLVPIAAVGLYALLSGGKKKPRRKKKKCPPYGIDRNLILAAAQEALDQGMVGPDRVAARVASTLYRKDTKGKPIPWPVVPPWQLPIQSPEALFCLFAEIKVLVRELPIPEEPGGPVQPTTGELLSDLIAATPTGGRFFLLRAVKDGGPLAAGNQGVAAQVLNKVDPGAGNSGAKRLAYIHLMTQPDTYNWDLYARDKTTASWPPLYDVDGRNLGAAWLPRHKNAIAAIAGGKFPQRNISLVGSKVGSGSSYALLWLPPLDKDSLKDLGVVTTGGAEWEDGSSVLNPPPELLSRLSDD